MATAAQLKKLFATFKHMRVMVIGDVMVDKYVYGNADRISPEAPVPVIEVRNAAAHPGGAANVAMNIRSLGATPLLFSVIGNDHDAILLEDLLTEHKVSAKHMLRADERITTSKMRVLARQHQLLRIDHEMQDALSPETAEKFDAQVAQALKRNKPDVVILEDYDKGVLSASRIRMIIDLCNQLEIPVVVDPKKAHFFSYHGCTLFKPNIRELRDSLSGSPDSLDTPDLKVAVDALHALLPHEITLLTLGEHGMFLRHHKKSYRVKAHLRSIADVSGAGDTVISVAALCLATGANAKTLLSVCNIAGGLVCEQSGVVPVDATALLKESLRLLV